MLEQNTAGMDIVNSYVVLNLYAKILGVILKIL